MSSQPSNQPDAADDLPEGLIADLRGAYSHTPRVPSSVDAAILTDAKTGFARRRRFRLAVRSTLGLAAAAAIVGVVFVPAFLRTPDSAQREAAQTSVNAPMLSIVSAPAEDVDGSGTVDILDAFVVAKLLDVQSTIDRRYDVNGDGKVDAADVDRIAVAAVDTSGAERRDGGRVQ